MTALRIVDRDNVSPLNTGFLPDVKKAVAAFLDCLEDGSVAPEKAMLVTISEQGQVDLTTFGRPMTNLEAVGMLGMATAQVIAGARP